MPPRPAREPAGEPQAAALRTLVTALPIWHQWGAQIPGLDPVAFGLLLSRTGDCWAYPTVAHLWTWMGVGAGAAVWLPCPVAGSTRRGVAGRTAQLAAVCRSVLRHPGRYRTRYGARVADLRGRAPVLRRRAIHAHARRYVGKCLLRDLWQAWHETMPCPPRYDT